MGIEPLLDFTQMQNIEKMLAEEFGISQFSAVGLFIRNVGILLERLEFPEIMNLHRTMSLYYEKGIYLHTSITFYSCLTCFQFSTFATPVISM